MSTLFSRQWLGSTLLVIVAMGVMVRLGFWQLDRLAQRRARNAEITRQLALPPLPLTGDPLPDDLSTLKNRRASAQGNFDFAHQVILKNQAWQGAPGVHLITPLVIAGSSRAVLVDRGWIPYDQAARENWSGFDEPEVVAVTGLIHPSETLPGAGSAPSSLSPQSEWFRVDIEAIQARMPGNWPYNLLPIYIQQSPISEGEASLPYRSEPEFDLSDGSHLGYAIQWYAFALILGIGYVRYVGK